MDSSTPHQSPTPSTILQELSASALRLNHRTPTKRDSMVAMVSQHHRPSGVASPIRESISVHEKIHRFEGLNSPSSRALDHSRGNNEALERAAIGREQAETEMRRYREEARMLRKSVDEGKDRERRVAERLEQVMENYGRSKEQHAKTQSLWEKEIRRTRKEAFKSQSVIVKLQEELKSARLAYAKSEESLEQEKQRSQEREQEAFAARYNLVGVQEQLDQALERIKVVEQERDAFKTLAKTEDDVTRIAEEGKLPLPPASPESPDASPVKAQNAPTAEPTLTRVFSISAADIKSSSAGEAEIDDLTSLWQWEQQRAARAEALVEFLQAECQLRACSCMKRRALLANPSPKRQKRTQILEDLERADRLALGEPSPNVSDEVFDPKSSLKAAGVLRMSASRQGTIFLPEESAFRTVSMQEAHDMMQVDSVPAEVEDLNLDRQESTDAPRGAMNENYFVEEIVEARRYARTPSADPPDFAVLAKERASLASLLEAPVEVEEPFHLTIPTIKGNDLEEEAKITVIRIPEPAAAAELEVRMVEDSFVQAEIEDIIENDGRENEHRMSWTAETESMAPAAGKSSFNSRPHTTTSFYKETSTTTRVPLKQENSEPGMAKRLLAEQLKTPTKQVADDLAAPVFDIDSLAMTPTMSRDQALAQIRERRGRARSAAQGLATPRKQMVEGLERRDVSAPTGRAIKGRTH